MKIVDVTLEDTGGQSFKIQRGINEYTNHQCISLVKSKNNRTTNYHYLYDEWVKKCAQEKLFVKNFLAEADIIHFHNKYRYIKGWLDKNDKPVNKKAKWLIHQHGRLGGIDYKILKENDRKLNSKRYVSTINLLKYVDYDCDRWIPAPFRLNEFDKIK